jgi:hypothetical protein
MNNSSLLTNIPVRNTKHTIKFDTITQKNDLLANSTKYSDNKLSKFSTFSSKFSNDDKKIINSKKKHSEKLETLVSEKLEKTNSDSESISSVDSKDTVVRANRFVDNFLGRDSVILITNPMLSPQFKFSKRVEILENIIKEPNKKKKTLKNMISSTLGDNQHIIPDISAIAPLIQVENPKLNEVLFKENKSLDGRRKVIYLYDKNDIKLFIEALELKQKRYLGKRFSLIPVQKTEVIINKSPRLRGIFRKCAMEVRISQDLQKLIHLEKAKTIKNANTQLKEESKALQENMNKFILDDDVIKPEINLNKVFIYNTKEGQGKVFESSLNIRNKVDFVEKISENMAYLNKTFFMHSLGYNYNRDDDFIFRDEILNQEKLLINDFRKIQATKIKKGNDKHMKVETLLNKAYKGNEKLINNIEEYLQKIKNKKRENHNMKIDIIKSPLLDGMSPMNSYNNKTKNFIQKSSKKINFSSKRNYSMYDMSSILPKL